MNIILVCALAFLAACIISEKVEARKYKATPVDPTKLRGHKRVFKHCDRYAALLALNQKYHFHELKSEYTYVVELSSLQSFRNFDCNAWFLEQMRREYALFCEKIEQAVANQSMLQDYDYSLNELPSRAAKRRWRRRETKYIAMAILRPVIDFTVTVNFSYTSPAGRNHYEDKYVFSMDEINAYCQSWRKRSEFVLFQSQQAKSRRVSSSGVSEAFIQTQRSIAKSLRYDILERDGFACQICGRTVADGVKLEVDHIIPVSKGGRSVPKNLRTLCYDCNRGKGTKIPKAVLDEDAQTM